MILCLLLIVCTTIALLVFMFKLGNTQNSQEISEKPNGDEMKKYIVWGCFYVNPNDPRGWVPRMNGIGVTVNFRDLKNLYIFIILILLDLAAALALIICVLQLLPN